MDVLQIACAEFTQKSLNWLKKIYLRIVHVDYLCTMRYSMIVLLVVSALLSGCFSAGDDFYSYILLKGSIQRENPEDMVDVAVDSRCTLMANDLEGGDYEVSIGAIENCNVVWTINNEIVQRAVVHKDWDTQNHLIGMEITVIDERSKSSKMVYSKTPDSREWIIEL